ncbi:MAG: peptide deformylase [Ardenticatenaceae bacterium]|nr:peptide deformylase [Ardenticatenaceae bacterium]
MEKLEIITPENPVLTQEASPVEKIDLELQTLIDKMIFTMRVANGVGLAAPQVGRSLRMAVIETPPEADDEGNDIADSRNLFVIINPQIVWASRKKVDGIEGCLSIPGYLGEVSRHQAIRVKGVDRRGKPLDLKLKGWTARIFQHEIDHLDGVLFTSKLTAPENYWTEEEYASRFDEETDPEEEAVAE